MVIRIVAVAGLCMVGCNTDAAADPDATGAQSTGSGTDAPSTTSGPPTETAGPGTTDASAGATDPDTTGAPGIVATISELDCHGRDAVEIATEPGVDLGGLEIVINGATDYTIPAGSISEGLFVVRESAGVEVGLSANIGCSDDEVTLVYDGVTLDAASFPGFPGSFKGTTWCSGVSAAPFELCTPTIGEPNLAYVDPGGVLFDRLAPVEIDLTLDQAGIDALDLEPREYVAGTFSVTNDGITSDPIMVGIALKGSPIGSFTDLSGKAAFKIKFDFVDPELRYLGLKGLKLNNMREDGSQLHEAVGYAIFGAVGVPAPRSGYAEVRLNGDSYGLHASVERADDVFLSRFYPSTTHLYEGTFGLDLNPGREDEFSIDEGDPLDTSDLTALMAVSVVPDDAFLAELETRVHLDAAVRMWAATMWIGHWDGYAPGKNNYEVHSDADGVFDFVPSGLDQTSEYLLDLRYGSSPIQDRGVLFDRCIDDPECFARYEDALDDVGAAIAAFDVAAEIDAIAAAIEPWVVADPRRESSVGQVHGAQDATRDFWAARAQDFP
jgi:CotH kinase protein